MKNRFILVLMLVLLLPMVVATTTIPITYDVTVDFTDVTGFRIMLPYGLEKYYTWNVNETHSDDTFVGTLYWELNETQYCVDSSEMVSRYQDLTTIYQTSSNLCNDLLVSYNDSYGFNGEMWDIQQQRIIDSENITKDLQLKYESLRTEKEQFSAQVAVLQGNEQRLNECKNDLTAANTSKSNNSVLFGVIGAIIGYFIWGRKKKIGPSEQVELGGTVDEFGGNYQ